MSTEDSISLDNSQNTTSIHQGQDEASEMDWEAELQQQKEIDALESNFANLSPEIREHYKTVLDAQSVNQRLLVYGMLASADWNRVVCENMLQVLLNTPNDPQHFHEMTSIIESFRKEIRILFLSIFSKTHQECIHEILTTLPKDALYSLMEVARHLELRDIDYMIQLIHDLTISEVVAIIDHCNEPFAKHCRLCRVRRMSELEFRMNNKQVPDGVDMLPGMVETYHQPEVWTAKEDLGFTFDVLNGLVFWRGTQVDMIRICDKCVVDVHNASVADTHFDEYHHLFGQERKDFIAQLKGREYERAILIDRLSIERIRRRAREFSLVALEKQRHGLEQERIGRVEVEKRIKREIKEEDKKKAREQYLNRVEEVDNKWADNDRKFSDQKFHHVKQTLTKLNYMPMFGPDGLNGSSNHVPIEREHPHSWRLKDVTADNVPLTEARAAHHFGHNDIAPEVHTKELSDWKEKTVESHNDYLQRIADEAAMKRATEVEIFNERVVYVDGRLKDIRRAEYHRQREAERLEELRLEQRAADRLIRRAARIAALEAAERKLMEPEDELSHQMRVDRNNAIIIAKEFEGMRRAESAQTRIDRFWGIPTHQAKLKYEQDVIDAAYRNEVIKYHDICVNSEIIKPTSKDELVGTLDAAINLKIK